MNIKSMLLHATNQTRSSQTSAHNLISMALNISCCTSNNDESLGGTPAPIATWIAFGIFILGLGITGYSFHKVYRPDDSEPLLPEHQLSSTERSFWKRKAHIGIAISTVGATGVILSGITHAP